MLDKKEKMNVEELIQELERIAKYQDPNGCFEDDHFKADGLLLNFINDQRVVDAFNKIQKWYA